MLIKNPRLKDYISRNTDGVTRSRANAIVVRKIDFSADHESLVAKVKGTKLYEVHFYGLQSGMISSSCTCPYDWGNVCKHEVAVANEIEGMMAALDTSAKDLSSKKVKTKSIAKKHDGIFTFSFKEVQEFDKAVFLKYTDPHIFSQGNATFVSNVFSEASKLILEIRGDYWASGIEFKTEIELLENELTLVSNCRCSKHRLCKHQVSALLFVHHHLPHLLLSEEDIENKKNQLLVEYGFSLEDKKHETYFKFENSQNGLEIIPLKEGILKKFEFSKMDYFSNHLQESEVLLRNQLPYKLKEKRNLKPKGIAFAFEFESLKNERRPSVMVHPITGNLNNEATLLSSKIEEIEVDTFSFKKEKFSTEEKALIEASFCLSESYLNSINSNTFLSQNYIHHKLLNLIPGLQNKIIYRSTGNSYKILKQDLVPIILDMNSADLEFKIIEEEDFYSTETYIIVNGKKQKLRNAKIGDNFLFVQKEETYYLNKSIYFSNVLSFFREKPTIRTVKSDFENFYKKIIAPLEETHKITFASKKKSNIKIKVTSVKKQVFLSEIDDYVVLKPVVEYQNNPIPIFSKKELIIQENNQETMVSRDAIIESEFETELREIHPAFKTQQTDFFFLEQEEFVKDAWFLNAFEILKEKGIEVFGFKNLNLKYNQHKPSISMSVSSDIDWFDVHIEVAFGEQIVSLKDLKKNILNKDKYIRLKDNTIGILPEEWIEKYTHLFRSGEIKKDHIGVSKYQFSVVDTLYEALENEHNLFEEHLRIKEKLKNFKEIKDVTTPIGVKATLRPYQKEGLKWLNFLDDYNLGGCLADDMGLGKTLQIITFFKHLKTKNKETIPHLIVVPTSLIFNWTEEVLKFCPSLKITTLTGVNRQKDTTSFKDFDIVLSTYGIVINDISYLKKYQFNYIVLDESQAIKNPNSKRFKAVRLLKAKNRLVLTGTPIENNTFDLYAQMTFVNPGLLGGMTHFKNEYATAIDKNKDKNVAKELKELIDPFLLRRTKEKVATELPPKTEQFLYCTMGSEQRKLYEAYKNKYKDYLLGKMEDDGLGKSKMYVLEGLTKLRQICDSPLLLNDAEEYTDQSVKIDELVRHIKNKASHHKILIFSQFVKMLGLIKSRLDELNITYEYLDGKTKNRQEKVANFQNNKEIRVFLISLKAGGTGLNLTAADYVYIVDPWWNPAVEAQAIDRCYRIGQKKNVTAYKMICKDTIEEKIVLHQQHKKQLSDDLIQTEDSYVKSLSKESIAALFS
ncbi:MULTISPECIES: SNF2-related protein [unclassified Polaribacter]|uniref:DEAD/DEAH box helicase n=1 Tax=unclassified Polaribacter TaxID=196858 RepID=UPI0011BF7E9A|nr:MULTISPECIES: SNF2-related protein [unclassified Polaribacter]TXD52604.1 ATP-dependent helicase [Polaribacter sp. IC063]TXD61834.1 ATP-dependent helicase [Polaribacter sp. IC066]